MVCILSSTYSQPLHEIRFYTRAKQIPLRQHCINCIGLILHRTVTIVSNLNGGKTVSSKKYFHVICFGRCPLVFILSVFISDLQCKNHFNRKMVFRVTKSQSMKDNISFIWYHMIILWWAWFLLSD